MSRILIADDSEPIRKMVALVLSGAGYTVDSAVDGVEALAIFKAAADNPYKLVVTDINMPNLGGIGLIRAIRAIDPNTPVLALTTEGDDKMRAQGRDAGADGWLVKPFKPAQFVDIVRNIIASEAT
ncbi:MAG: response regulator [Spirochaetes bacterium]|nr:response regulator [Spirochaetota bacterium]